MAAAEFTTGDRSWTTPADVVRRLRRRWDTGVPLTMYASGSPWEPVGVAIRGPAAVELADRYGDAQDWTQQWRRAAGPSLRLDHKPVGGRLIGANNIPCRAWIDGYEQLWSILGVTQDVKWFMTALADAAQRAPRISEWMRTHPMKALNHRRDWNKLIATVCWIGRQAQAGMYLRQVDVPGVDTKFIESHRGILSDLLDAELLADRIDQARPRADFAGRYRFRKKPSYVRFRLLADGPAEFSELTVRADELTRAPAHVSTVYVVENEITYLAFPPVERAMAVFGGGYAVTTLELLPWLAETRLVYWGDIDTHGFSILDRLRRRFDTVTSLLMDRATLLAHESQWVTEESPINDKLDQLCPDEADLYRDLVQGTLGRSIRLEQERIRFSAIRQALSE